MNGESPNQNVELHPNCPGSFEPRMSPDHPVRALIIGCGIIGKHHALVISRHESFMVAALVDPKSAAVDAVADAVVAEGQPRPESYPTIEAALAVGGIDLAVVCTPSGYHIDHAEQAIAGGVGAVIEKPLDVSVARGREFAQVAAKAAADGLLVSVISQHRFDPANAKIHRTISSGGFGRITSAVATMAWYRSQQYYDSGDWRGTWSLDGGGAVMNQGVHTVDLLRWFCGRPAEIFAHSALLAHDRVEIEDTATASIRFESGALAVIHCTTAAYPGLSARLQVHGESGSAIVDNDELQYLHTIDDDRAGHGSPVPNGGDGQADRPADQDAIVDGRIRNDGFVAGHLRQYDDLAGALQGNRDPLVTVDEALLSLALVRSLYVSATLGEPVCFDDVVNGRYDDLEATVADPSMAALTAAKSGASK